MAGVNEQGRATGKHGGSGQSDPMGLTGHYKGSVLLQINTPKRTLWGHIPQDAAQVGLAAKRKSNLT